MTQAPDSDNEIAELYASINAPRPILVVISGPSGVGKDATLQLMQRRNVPYYFVVTARQELRRYNEFDYIVVNRENELDETVSRILNIIEAEKCKVDWSPVKI